MLSIATIASSARSVGREGPCLSTSPSCSASAVKIVFACVISAFRFAGGPRGNEQREQYSGERCVKAALMNEEPEHHTERQVRRQAIDMRAIQRHQRAHHSKRCDSSSIPAKRRIDSISSLSATFDGASICSEDRPRTLSECHI